MLGPVGNEDEGAGSGIGRVRALSLVSRMLAGAGTMHGVMCGTWWWSGVVPAARVGGLSGGGRLPLQDVWVCLLEAVEGAEEASLDAGHVLFPVVGVVLAGGVWARPQQVKRRAATMYRQSCMVVGRAGIGPVRFREASLCWGRRVTFNVHCSAGIPEVRWVHLARQYIALPRCWLQLWMESSVSRDLRSHLPQMWGSSGSSSLVYMSGRGRKVYSGFSTVLLLLLLLAVGVGFPAACFGR